MDVLQWFTMQWCLGDCMESVRSLVVGWRALGTVTSVLPARKPFQVRNVAAKSQISHNHDAQCYRSL